MADAAPGERASVLMLVPAAVLVLFVLGAIAVDFAVAFLAQRELSNAAAAAANDAAAAAVSDEVFYRGAPGTIEIDGGAADRFVRRALDARRPRGVTDVASQVRTSGNQVCVTVTGRVSYIFAKAVPGGPQGTTVKGQAVATAVLGDERVPTGDGVC